MEFTSMIFIFIITCFIIYIWGLKKDASLSLPGPQGYPLVGNTFHIDFKKIHLTFYSWFKIYGDLYQVKLFGKTFVIINSSRIVRELFSKEPNGTLTSARPDTFIRNYLLSGADVVFASLDKDWIRRRKLMHKLINSYGDGLQKIEKKITAKLSEIRNKLLEPERLTCDPQELVEDFVMSLVEILLVGRCGDIGSEFHKYLFETDEALNYLVNVGFDLLYTNLPFLRFLPLPPSRQYRQFLYLRKRLLGVLDEQAGDSNIGLYPSMKQLVRDDCNTKPWLTEKVMESMIFDIIGAGFLTTRGILLTLIRILIPMPDVQSKLQEEVDRVVGRDREPALQDRHQMPYTEAVILETLRYSSHFPIALLHSASQDIVFGKYKIPKGAVIVSNQWAMHHNEKEWKDPFQFYPERFLSENGELLPPDNEVRKCFMAFGIGRRSCLGEVLAKARIFLFLSTIMQASNILPPDGEEVGMLTEEDMVPGSVMYPRPFTCRIEKRKIGGCNQ